MCVTRENKNNNVSFPISVAHTMELCRWELIAGRIPGRTAEEVEIFWSKKHQDK
jgi:myb proto-oncogene protein